MKLFLDENVGLIMQKLHSISDLGTSTSTGTIADLDHDDLLAIIDDIDFPDKSVLKKF